jgi:hypothetical protein
MRLGRRAVEHGVVKQLADLARSQSKPGIPTDIGDFCARARVEFLDAAGKVVEIESATIMWEE